AYVDGELERNPLLERPGEGESERGAAEREPAAGPDSAASEWMDGAPADRTDAPESRVASDLDDGAAADTDAAASRANADATPGYSEWAGAGTGRREDGEYNLEAFVSVEATLTDHLAEQLTLAVSDPVRRMIGQYLIDLVDEAGYLTGDLAQVAEKLGAP